MTMRAAIVILADARVQNYARRIVYALNKHHGVPFYASRLPVHVSLKQPFAFESIDALEDYFDGLAARIPPFDVDLDHLYCAAWEGYGILGLNVIETPRLRDLHDLLNEELPMLFEDTRAAHDGSEYHFHLTIEMGKTAATNPFQEMFDSLGGDAALDLRFTARELGLFYYPDDALQTGAFIHYRTQPLTGTA